MIDKLNVENLCMEAGQKLRVLARIANYIDISKNIAL